MKHEKLTTSNLLCPIGARFVDELRNNGKNIFTLDEAAVVYGKSKQLTSRFLRSLIDAGLLISIIPGKYLFQLEDADSPDPYEWLSIGRGLVGSHPYVVSHHSAMWLHGMTTQRLTDAYFTLSTRIRDKTLKGINYNFMMTQKSHSWGVTTHITPEKEKFRVTDIERTILDGLERPELCGGMKNVIYGIWAVQSNINWDRLMKYSAQYQTMAAIKRLGCILELLGLAPQCLPILTKITAPSECYVSLDPPAPKVGRCLIRWHMRVNMNIEELLNTLSQKNNTNLQPLGEDLLRKRVRKEAKYYLV